MNKKSIVWMALAKGLIFVCFILILCAALMPIFRPAMPTRSTVGTMPADCPDVLFVGGSTFMRGVSPSILWEEENLVSYVLANSNQAPWTQYLCAVNALKKHNPKLVVLGVGQLSSAYYPEDPTETRRRNRTQLAFDHLPMNVEKLAAASDISFHLDPYSPDGPLTSLSKFVFPLFANHSRWSVLKESDYFPDPEPYTFGQAFSRDVSPLADQLHGRIDEGAPLSDPGYCDPDTLAYYEKTIKACLASGAEVCLLVMPVSGWQTYHAAPVAQLAQRYGLQCIDLNYDRELDLLGLDPAKDFCDPSHLNIAGSVKATRVIARHLTELYDLPPRPETDGMAAQMDENLARFQEDLAEGLNEPEVVEGNEFDV